MGEVKLHSRDPEPSTPELRPVNLLRQRSGASPSES